MDGLDVDVKNWKNNLIANIKWKIKLIFNRILFMQYI